MSKAGQRAKGQGVGREWSGVSLRRGWRASLYAGIHTRGNFHQKINARKYEANESEPNHRQGAAWQRIHKYMAILLNTFLFNVDV